MRITVLNGGVSNSVAFLVTPAGGLITALQPDSAVAGGAGFTLAVTGGGFVATSQLLWNGSPLATTFFSSTQLAAAVSAALIAIAGTVNITVSDGDAVSSPALFPVQLSTEPTITAIANAGSYSPSFASGTLISIFGANLAGAEATPGNTPLPTSLGGVTVTINGVPAPLLYVGPSQINAQIPFEVAVGAASLEVDSGSGQTDPVPMTIAATAPGVLQDAQHHAVAQNAADYSLNSTARPAQAGTYLVVYLTGQGLLDNPVASGAAASDTPLSRPLAPVSATIAGQPAAVVFAGLTPGLVGVCQVDLLVPSVPAGEQPLIITVGGVAANQTTVSIH